MKVGVIGLGWWGPKLVRNFVGRLGASGVVACDLDTKRTREVQKHLGVVTTNDVEALLNDPSVDAVAIATPPATHHHLTRRAFENGKHVVVEKPPAMTIDELDELIGLARRHQRVYMADSTYVYAPVIRALRALLRDPRVGAVRALQSLRYGDNLRRDGRGRLETAVLQHGIDVVEDLIFHDLAILAYLFDDPLELSNIHRFDGLEPGIADVAYVDGSVGGVPVHIGLSWTLPERRRDIVVYAERALIRADDLAERDKLIIHWMAEARDEVAPMEDYHQEPLFAVVSHFLECIDTGLKPETGPSFMRRAMLGFSACRACRRNAPVQL